MAAISGDCTRCARTTHGFLEWLGEEGLRALMTHRRHRPYARGSVLFRQGEEADEVFCIAGALVKLVHRPPEGREAVVGILSCGDVAGLSAALGPGVHPYTAEVVTGGPMGCIPRAALLALLDDHPAFARGLIGQVAAEAHRGVRQAALLAEPRLAPKLAALLLSLGGGAPAGCRAVVAAGLTRRDLAGLCGVGHEAVVRCLARWKRAGLVDTRGGPITLLDPEGLAAIAGDRRAPSP